MTKIQPYKPTYLIKTLEAHIKYEHHTDKQKQQQSSQKKNFLFPGFPFFFLIRSGIIKISKYKVW